MRSFFKKILRPIKIKLIAISLNIHCEYLKSKNKKSTRTIQQGNNIVVSLTTYGKRFHTVYLTLESIFSGALLPSRIILWIDDVSSLDNLPKELVLLQARGLEVKLTKNFGPHKKYYPYIKDESVNVNLVTADDDILYPKRWLKDLYDTHLKNPETVICHRAHKLTFEKDGSLKGYNDWVPCCTTDASQLHFSTGCSGALYPSSFLKIAKQADLGFQGKCPRADDVWLHWLAISNGYSIKQVKRKAILFPMIPETQDSALVNFNVGENGNDVQIRNTYSENDIARLNGIYKGVSNK